MQRNDHNLTEYVKFDIFLLMGVKFRAFFCKHFSISVFQFFFCTLLILHNDILFDYYSDRQALFILFSCPCHLNPRPLHQKKTDIEQNWAA